jgi:hypothetical protein
LRGGHGSGLRVHEQAHAHAQRAGFGDQRAQALGVGREVQPWSLVNWSSPSGTKVAWCGRSCAHEVHQVLERVAFDVELGGPGGASISSASAGTSSRGCGARRAAGAR